MFSICGSTDMFSIIVLQSVVMLLASTYGQQNGTTTYQCSDPEVTCATQTPFISCRHLYKIKIVEVRVKDVTSCLSCRTSWWQTSCTCRYHTALHYHAIAEEALEKQCEGLQTCEIASKNKAVMATYKCAAIDEDLGSQAKPSSHSEEDDGKLSKPPTMLKIYVDGKEKDKTPVGGYIVMLLVGVILVVILVVSLIYRIKMQRKRDRQVNDTNADIQRPTLTVAYISNGECEIVHPDGVTLEQTATTNDPSCTDNSTQKHNFDNPPSYESCMYDDLNHTAEGNEYTTNPERCPGDETGGEKPLVDLASE